MRRARWAAAVVGVVASALLAGCGLPHDQSARALDPKQVPYGLLQSSTPPPTDDAELKSTKRTGQQAELYLLDGDDQLVGVPAGVGRQLTTSARLAALFSLLERGPDDNQRSQGLSSAWTPGVRIQLRDFTDGLAQVEVAAGLKDPSADQLPLAIGQLVLTATSLREVDAVQLVRDGQPVEVPLPGGALTSAPLTRQDYASLLTR
ncbi:GerMN domain-containing protein [Angustibacter sp. Root456]|uniref:GerMN domain-containing protein n=1 Tax=Angustibacter sp. Root456 TaxID=1736539 RepID=UPI00138F2228|nr:GerMN domain-containing protein [Angustibacter sp. Root456]